METKIDAGGRGGRRLEYGRTYVVRPKGRHQATIVWPTASATMAQGNY